MSNSADTVAGMMWDDFREKLNELKTNGNIDRETYWYLTDLINDYGHVMKLAGIRGEITRSTERVVRATMGLDAGPGRTGYEKYDFSG